MESRKYGDYLSLDTLLDGQRPLSEAHDEMLFIVIHQVYEIWFKQILFELDGALEKLAQEEVAERDLPWIVARLKRCNEIWRVCLEQVRVLETMSPMDFLDFRRFLGTMSGVQSYQFRVLENKLGLQASSRVGQTMCPYASPFSKENQEALLAMENEPTLFSCLDRWLARMPFLKAPGFCFVQEYCEAADQMMEEEGARLLASADLNEHGKQTAIRGVKELRDRVHEMLQDKDQTIRLQHDAFVAALFIRVFGNEPLFQWPNQLLREAVEFEGRATEWRYRHGLMVLKMIGQKQGTGGSSGHEYLLETAKEHKVFADFHRVTTLLMPRAYLPKLSEPLKQSLNFSFGVTHG